MFKPQTFLAGIKSLDLFFFFWTFESRLTGTVHKQQQSQTQCHLFAFFSVGLHNHQTDEKQLICSTLSSKCPSYRWNEALVTQLRLSRKRLLYKALA